MSLRRALLALAIVACLAPAARAQSSAEAKAQVDALVAKYQALVDKGGTEDEKAQLAFLKKLRADMDKPLTFPETVPGVELQERIDELTRGIAHLTKQLPDLQGDAATYASGLIKKFEDRKGVLEKQLTAWQTGEGANVAEQLAKKKAAEEREATLKLLDDLKTSAADCLDKNDLFRLERLRKLVEGEPTARPIDKLPGNELASGLGETLRFIQLVKKLEGDVCTSPAQKTQLQALGARLETRRAALDRGLKLWLGEEPEPVKAPESSPPSQTQGIVKKVTQPPK